VIVPKLAGAAAALASLFGIGALTGGVLHPSAPGGSATGAMSHRGEKMAMEVRGLAVADHDLRLVVADPELRRGREQQLRFRIV
jgi:hypothetical protein